MNNLIFKFISLFLKVILKKKTERSNYIYNFNLKYIFIYQHLKNKSKSKKVNKF